MKLTKKLEIEIRQVMDEYWNSYFKGDLEKWAHFLPDNYRNIGSTEEEIWNSKEEMMNYSKTVIHQMVGTVEARNKQVQIIPLEPYFMVHEFQDFYINTGKEWVFYAKFRLSSLIQKTDDGWKVLHQHGSVPDTKAQEGESIGFETISKENLELREAIKRRTVELEQKNRELEIEASLERVRTVAMSMKKPDDMLDVCRVISEQLEILGTKEIRNVQTAIFYKDKGTYVNFEYYKLHDKSLVTEVDYTQDTMTSTFASTMQNGAGVYFTESLTGKALTDWFEYQKTTVQFADPYLEEASSLNYYWFSLGAIALGISSYSPLKEEEINLFKRFRNVFELSYRRFLDIQKAEAQAQEAKIEAALERVRSRALAMHKTDELLDAAELVYKELSALGITSMNISYAFVDEEEKYGSYYSINPVDGKIPPFPFVFPHTETGVMRSILSSWKKQEPFHVIELDEEATLRHQTYIGEHIHQLIKEKKVDIPFSVEAFLAVSPKKAVIYTFNFSKGYLFNIGGSRLTASQEEMLLRFTRVFEMTYRRFLDLKQAEAQAREAHIEAALERVRSRSMGMQKSDELKEIIRVVYEQFVHLNINVEHTGFVMDYKARNDYYIWIAGRGVPSQVTIPYFDSVYYNRFNEAKEKGMDFFATNLTFEEKNTFYQTLFEYVPGLPEEEREFYSNCPGLAISTVLLENVCLYIENFSGIPYSAEDNATLMRFGNVFQQTYTRFLDLQKAEAQTRESQIELGLERVRARAMAMQKSDELRECVLVIYEQLQQLDFDSNACNIIIIDHESGDTHYWVSGFTQKIFPEGYHVPCLRHPYHENLLAACRKNEKYVVMEYSGEMKQSFDEIFFTQTDFRNIPEEAKQVMIGLKTVKLSTAFFTYGALQVLGPEALSEAKAAILQRFGKVFEQTYTRFLDLQKAEAQSKEAQIELGLERVRARAMAMQKSDELKELIGTVFTELTRLDLVLARCLIMIYDPATNDSTWWMANSEAPSAPTGLVVQYHEHPTYLTYVQAWQERTLKWEYVLEGKIKIDWDDFLFTETGLKALPDYVVAGMKAPDKVYLNSSFNSFGNLTLATLAPLSDEHFDLMLRFAKVFDLTYTRFNDLQKAEAQSREARIEASLERVRAKAMSMHNSQDLADTIGLFYHELELFSITPRRCGVGLLNKETRIAELSTMNTNQQGKSIELIGKIKMEGHPVLEGVYKNWTLNKEYHPVLRGSEIKEYYQLLKPQIAFPDYSGDTVQYGYFFFFAEGGVYAWTDKEMGDDELKIYRRFTSVLSLTYKRYKDLQQAEELAHQAEQDLVNLKAEKKKTEDALAELKTTQFQLIQAEKMASLGELTAGIAHEIQNPLNFVNNFSEVSTELVVEMNDEIKKGNLEDAAAIAHDLKKNLEKINHHGKRAGDIVKGMLQHSRSGAATKEPTDINKLTDEYVRLGYHGLRAKDKTFNITLHTDYDEQIGSVSIIPQDIGRAVLNLITNASYVVTEKKKSGIAGYEPTVSISTKRNGNTISIAVKDNGNGIPQKIFDKMFQPFFTTKPAGQGTGLGLSLAYDIVKAHGGELKAETKEGHGSTFFIQLPVN